MYNISYNVKVTLISLVFIKADFDSGQIARIIEKALWSNQVSRSFDFHFLKNSKFFSTYQSKLPIFRRHFCFLYCPISRDSKFTLWAVSRKNLTHAALATQHKISHSRKGKIAKKVKLKKLKFTESSSKKEVILSKIPSSSASSFKATFYSKLRKS